MMILCALNQKKKISFLTDYYFNKLLIEALADLGH
jgi:hypothetical protein